MKTYKTIIDVDVPCGICKTEAQYDLFTRHESESEEKDEVADVRLCSICDFAQPTED